MEKSIRVRVLGREYALRVREEDEAITRQIAAYVDEKMQLFKHTHPEQPELTTAVITAMAIAEEYYASREQQQQFMDSLDEQLSELDDCLVEALGIDELEESEEAEQDETTNLEESLD